MNNVGPSLSAIQSLRGGSGATVCDVTPCTLAEFPRRFAQTCSPEVQVRKMMTALLGFSLGLLLDIEGDDSMFLRNVGILHIRENSRPNIVTVARKTQISQLYFEITVCLFVTPCSVLFINISEENYDSIFRIEKVVWMQGEAGLELISVTQS
jgi:hypothetical protein